MTAPKTGVTRPYKVLDIQQRAVPRVGSGAGPHRCSAHPDCDRSGRAVCAAEAAGQPDRDWTGSLIAMSLRQHHGDGDSGGGGQVAQIGHDPQDTSTVPCR